jgi:DNA replication protein DnaC
MDAIIATAPTLRDPTHPVIVAPTLHERMTRWHTEAQLLRDPHADPRAVAEEQGWYCPYCGQLTPPATFLADPWGRPGRGMWIAPTHHGCPQERALIEQQTHLEQERREAERARRRAELLAHAGLVERWSEATFGTYQPRREWPQAAVLRAGVQRYVASILAGETTHCWLVLTGNYGTGKSHLAAAGVRAVLEAGRRAYFRVWPQYLKRLQLSWGEDAEEREADILEEMADGWLVALDDLDKRRDPSGWGREMLFSFLNERYNKRLPTIITLNTALTAPDPTAPGHMALEAITGGAVLDRIFEMATVLDFSGPSYR